MEADTRKELEATVAARRELGPEHDEQLIPGFLDRIEGEIDRRVEAKLARSRPGPPLRKEALGIAVPIVVVAGIFGGPAGVFTALAALLVAFLVVAVGGRRR